MAQKAIGETFAVDEIYIQYEHDMARIMQQRRDTLDVLRYYKSTDLLPTKRRLIPNTKDYKMLVAMLGLEDIA